MTTRKEVERHVLVEPYSGANETINRLLGEDTLWIVQGPKGRLPMLGTQESVRERYIQLCLAERIDDEDE